MEPPKNAQALPRLEGPFEMKCWTVGGVTLGDGARAPYLGTIGSWRRSVVEGGGCGELRFISGDSYTGEWMPHSNYLGPPGHGVSAEVAPCVLTRGSEGRRYLKFRWLAYKNCCRNQSGQIDYHRQLAQDLLQLQLPTDRVVHHISWDYTDNSVANLEVVDKAWHDHVGNVRRGQQGARRGTKREWAASRH